MIHASPLLVVTILGNFTDHVSPRSSGHSSNAQDQSWLFPATEHTTTVAFDNLEQELVLWPLQFETVLDLALYWDDFHNSACAAANSSHTIRHAQSEVHFRVSDNHAGFGREISAPHQTEGLLASGGIVGFVDDQATVGIWVLGVVGCEVEA